MTLNISRYVKRPVTIEAVQVTEENIHEVAAWCSGTVESYRFDYPNEPVHYLLIPTLEGVMRGDIGDFIIRGVKGEYYPCKPEIFHDSYNFVGVANDPDQLELELDL